jgi:hypothetical protein
MRCNVWRSLPAAAACALLALAAPVQAQDADAQFTGSWIHYLNASGLPSGPYIPTLITFHSDGTMMASSALMFGSPSMPYAPVRYSPVHAVWEKIGPKTIAVTSLFFATDPEGRMTGYQRNRIVLELAGDRHTYTGLLFLDMLACPSGVFSCPNPLDPAGTWTPNPNMPQGGYQVTGYRLKVVDYPY